MNVKLKIDEEVFNKWAIDLYRDPSRWLVLRGGASSGKSKFAAQKVLFRCMLEQGHRICVVRKIAKTIKESCFNDILGFIKQWNIEQLWDINHTLMKFRYKPNKNEIISIGIDDREKIKSLSGITSLWYEEPTELEPKDFRQMELRLRGYHPNYKQSILTFNPISELSWIKERFYDDVVEQELKKRKVADRLETVYVQGEKVELNTHYSLTTYKDNKFLDLETKAELERLEHEDLNYYKIYCLAEWGSIGNLVYQGFKFREFPSEFDDEFYGLDFGYNNPTCLLHIGVRDKVYYITELIYEKRLTNGDLIQRMEEIGVNKDVTIYADSAEPDRIKEISECDYDIKPADKSVKDGIDYVQRCEIVSKLDNVNINKEVKTYKWKEDASGKVLEEPIKTNDHALDALRYGVYTNSKKVEFRIGFIE